ncbi:VWA domain-containing protein [Persephonella sp.]
MVEFLEKDYFWLIIPVLITGWIFIKLNAGNRFEFWSFFAVALILIAALAHPVLKKGEKVFYKNDTEIAVVIDHSLSMAVDDIRPDRLTVAVRKAKQLIKMLKDEKVAVVTFADEVDILLYPYQSVSKELDKLNNLKLKPQGSTDLIDALSIANSLLTGKERIIVLISDGGDEELEKIKELVETSGVKFVFLGVATGKGGKVPGYNALSRLNTELAEFARQHGLFVQVTEDDTDIKTIAEFIKGISEKTKTVLMKVESKTELSPFLGLLALLIIFVNSLSKRFIATGAAVLLFSLPSQAGNFLGYIYYITGNYRDAAREFISEKDPASKYNGAVAYFKAGMYDKAQQILKGIITENPSLKKKVRYTLALCYLAKKDFKSAYKIAEELIELYPQEKRIRKLYHFTNMIVSMDRKPEKKKTVVKIKEKKSQQFKSSPMEIGDKNPW